MFELILIRPFKWRPITSLGPASRSKSENSFPPKLWLHPNYMDERHLFELVVRIVLSKASLAVLMSHRQVFAKFPGLCKLQSDELIVKYPYSIAQKYRDAVIEEINKMLSLAIIEKNQRVISIHFILYPRNVLPLMASHQKELCWTSGRQIRKFL